MQFLGITHIRSSITPEQQRQLSLVFNNWTPPKGAELKFLYVSSDTLRSFGLVETDDPAHLQEIAAVFSDFLEFEWVPVSPADQAAPLRQQAQQWVDQVVGR